MFIDRARSDGDGEREQKLELAKTSREAVSEGSRAPVPGGDGKACSGRVSAVFDTGEQDASAEISVVVATETATKGEVDAGGGLLGWIW